jgi:hypothetical protein
MLAGGIGGGQLAVQMERGEQAIDQRSNRAEDG